MEIINKTKDSLKETRKQVWSQTLGLMTSAFALVAALAWNDAIHELISQYLKAGSGLLSRFVYAIIVTVLAVVVSMRLNKLARRFKDDDVPPLQ